MPTPEIPRSRIKCRPPDAQRAEGRRMLVFNKPAQSQVGRSRTQSQVGGTGNYEKKKKYYFYDFSIILKTDVYCQCFRALSQRLAERSAIPQAKTAGADRRRRAQNAGFYQASALAGMPNGQLRKNKKKLYYFCDFGIILKPRYIFNILER